MSAEPGSKTFELLSIAEKTSETARELGKRLLTFAKGGDALMQTTDVKPLILDGVSEELGGAGINYAFDLPDNLPQLRIDVAQIRQVITQLAINAREAMPQGGSLRISASTLSLTSKNDLTLEPGEYLHIVLVDSGVGIPPENLPRIFDPYFTTKEMGCQKGMGLGLALSNSIIRHHHGLIVAESNPGEGTSMHIYLPVYQDKT
jgi:signal transduction histidine kinase